MLYKYIAIQLLLDIKAFFKSLLLFISRFFIFLSGNSIAFYIH